MIAKIFIAVGVLVTLYFVGPVVIDVIDAVYTTWTQIRSNF